MTLAWLLILVGLLLIYAGIKGLSPIALMLGRVQPSKKPRAAQR